MVENYNFDLVENLPPNACRCVPAFALESQSFHWGSRVHQFGPQRHLTSGENYLYRFRVMA